MMSCRLWGEDIGYVFTTSKKVAPGRTVYSDYLNVPDSIKIDRAYFGVSKIAYTDGTVEQAPEIDYSYWQIEE